MHEITAKSRWKIISIYGKRRTTKRKAKRKDRDAGMGIQEEIIHRG